MAVQVDVVTSSGPGPCRAVVYRVSGGSYPKVEYLDRGRDWDGSYVGPDDVQGFSISHMNSAPSGTDEKGFWWKDKKAAQKAASLLRKPLNRFGACSKRRFIKR